MRPVHLDDIHYIVTDENAAVSFWTEHFGAKEMAQPLVPFHFIRNVSVRLFDPTIVISSAGPYGSSSEKADARWRARQRVDPRPDLPPHYGVHRLALKTRLQNARQAALDAGLRILSSAVKLPHDPDADAFVIQGPDCNPVAIVVRNESELHVPELELIPDYGIDHVQFLVKDCQATARFLTEVFFARQIGTSRGTAVVRVADAILVLSEPEALGIERRDVEERDVERLQRFSVDHLAFLYTDIWPAVQNAQDLGHKFDVIQSSGDGARGLTHAPARYRYFGKPSAYTAISIMSPDRFAFELVMVDGRSGPMVYFREPPVRPDVSRR